MVTYLKRKLDFSTNHFHFGVANISTTQIPAAYAASNHLLLLAEAKSQNQYQCKDELKTLVGNIKRKFDKKHTHLINNILNNPP